MNPDKTKEELWSRLIRAVLALERSTRAAPKGKANSARRRAVAAAQALLQTSQVASEEIEAEEINLQSRAQKHWVRFEEDIQLAHLMSEAALISAEAGQVNPQERQAALAYLSTFATQVAPISTERASSVETGLPPLAGDRQAAIVNYAQRVDDFYTILIEEAGALLRRAYQQLRTFDLAKILQSLKELFSPAQSTATTPDELTACTLTALQNARRELQQMQRMGMLKNLEEEFRSLWEALHQEDALRGFMEYSFARRQGVQRIARWLETTLAEAQAIQSGAIAIQALTQNMQKTMAVHLKLFQSLERLQSLVAWLTRRATLSFPLETILLGMYVVSMDIALLQGMDYADSAQLIDWVEGVVTKSKQALRIENPL